MRYHNFIRIDPAGQLDKFKVPTFYDPFDVAEKLPHSLIFMIVPKRFVVSARRMTGGEDNLQGPAVTLIHEGRHYEMPRAPQSDTEATRFWMQYCDSGRAVEK